MNKIQKRCNNCCISEDFPGVVLDKNGQCNLCFDFKSSGKDNKIIQTNFEKIDRIINKRKNLGLYDVIVAYSGGKDSSYALHFLKEKYDLNILALLIDNDFVAEQAMKNAKSVTTQLGIDLIIFKPDPSFMRKMYNKSINGNFYNLSQLSRANAACLSCINLINTQHLLYLIKPDY